MDEVDVKQQPAAIECSFEVISEGSVRLAVLRREDLRYLDEKFLVATPALPRSALRYTISQPGKYVVVVDNRGDRRAKTVRLRISLDFGPSARMQIRYLTRERQLAVIAISFAVFFGIVTWSARKLLQATRR